MGLPFVYFCWQFCCVYLSWKLCINDSSPNLSCEQKKLTKSTSGGSIMSNIDPCECVDLFNHESAMRRLINMLRDSQNACSDGGCEELPGNPGAPNATDGYMMLMLGWVFVATILYFLRPKNFRAQGNEKPSPSGGGPSPPPPGPAVN